MSRNNWPTISSQRSCAGSVRSAPLRCHFGAGFGEETVFRGFLFAQFRKLLGGGTAATAMIVLATSAWFGLAHYSVQGWDGVKQAAVCGLVFGTIFAKTGRIWMLMVAHAAFDVTATAIIYWDLESDIAHWLFN